MSDQTWDDSIFDTSSDATIPTIARHHRVVSYSKSTATNWLVHQIGSGTRTTTPVYSASSNTLSNGFINRLRISSATTIAPTVITGVSAWSDDDDQCLSGSASRDIVVQDGREITLRLPDGSRIEIKKDGSYEIADADAKVIYRANRIREFNPFLNASDKLEDFIRFCGTVGVRQGEVLGLPIELFIGWLIIEAAKADEEPEPDLALIPDLKKRAQPRCNGCGRFLARFMRQRKLDFCKPVCFEHHYNRALAPA